MTGFCRRLLFVPLCSLLVLNPGDILLAAEESQTPASSSNDHSAATEEPIRQDQAALRSQQILDTLRGLNAQIPLPEAEFEAGHTEPLQFDQGQVTRTMNGFVIQLPSESPIPTPTIHGGRLYVSGGFSSEEYYCFEPRTGKCLWAVQLDDDGPSSAVPFEDSILISCESCTIFALDAATGKLRWSHWLGDPLLSMPAVAGHDVYITYPAEPEMEPAEGSGAINLKPTHIIAAFDAATGKPRWRRWIDSDCMTAPVAAENDLYLTSLSGTLYGFGRQTGELRLAQRLQATSAPVPLGDRLYLTRRADEGAGEIAECVTSHNRSTLALHYAAARYAAPYLDEAVQREALFSEQAADFEAPNAIGGGFGGGFGGGGIGGAGHFSVEDETHQDSETPESVEGVGTQASAKANDLAAADPVAPPADALAVTERQAAAVIGLGNVSTLQAFQGSRILYHKGRLFSCMGDRLVGLDAATGGILWTVTLEGDLKQVGGHLATPPIAVGEYLLIVTVDGEVRLIDAASGKTERSWEVGSQVRFPPTVDGGWIYVGTQDGKVVCIETDDPELTGWPMTGGDPAHRNIVPNGE